jgi:hypothetical protein
MTTEHGDDYIPHEWSVYFLGLDEEIPPTTPTDKPYKVCGMNSAAAKFLLENGDPDQNRFYYDLEQVEAGLEPAGTSGLERLAREWRGHKAGALVMSTFQKIKEKPPLLTFMVENTAETGSTPSTQ